MKRLSVLFAMTMIFSFYGCASTGAKKTVVAAKKPDVIIVSKLQENSPQEYSLEKIVENLTVRFADGYYQFTLKNLPPSWKIKKGEITAIPRSVSSQKWAEVHPTYNMGMYAKGNSLEITLLWTKKIFDFNNQKLRIPVRIQMSYRDLSEPKLDILTKAIKNAIEHRKKMTFEFNFYYIWPKVEDPKEIGLLGITIEFIQNPYLEKYRNKK